MATESFRLLLIEDNPADARLLRELLSASPLEQFEVLHAQKLADGLSLLAADGVDVVLLDLSLPDALGAHTVASAHAAAPEIPIIVLTGLDDDETAIRAMQEGAQDYLFKGQLDSNSLLRSIRYARERKKMEEHTRRLIREQTARVQAEAAARRLAFLSEASRVLASSLDLETTFASIARLSVPVLCDYCTIDLLDAAGHIHRVAAAHIDETKQPFVDGTRAFPPRPELERHPVVAAMKEGRTVMLELATPDDFGPFIQSPEHRALLSHLGPRTMMTVPLLARGATLGALSFVLSESRRTYGKDEVWLAEELANRAAMAVDNARLYRAREEILGVVSHDLRNPLNVIGLSLASLRREQSPSPSQQKNLDKMGRAVSRMNRLIQDLLDVTRMEAGGLSLTPSSIEVPALLQDAAEMLRALAEEKTIEFRVQAEPELLPVMADRERALQVFSNLVGNAIKFTPSGGQVIVGAKRDGKAICFSVSDNGPGIAAHDLNRIFDRYWQGRAKAQGAGLGLAIAKGIVDAHGGKIWVESRMGQGATFFFTLPLFSAPAPNNGRSVHVENDRVRPR